MRMTLAMKPHSPRPTCKNANKDGQISNSPAGVYVRRGATNLTLTKEARDMGEILIKAMNRPSLSNVVEALIQEKGKELGLVPAPVAAGDGANGTQGTNGGGQ